MGAHELPKLESGQLTGTIQKGVPPPWAALSPGEVQPRAAAAAVPVAPLWRLVEQLRRNAARQGMQLRAQADSRCTFYSVTGGHF